jgi:signal transduction histidine kinase
LKLLYKTILYYIIISAVIFSTGGIVFYRFVRSIIIGQIDTSLLTEKEIIEEQILHFDSVPDFTTVFGHQIEVTVYDYKVKPLQKIVDTLITDSENKVSTEYRQLLATSVMPDGRGYKISIYKSLEDTHNLIADIFLVVCLVLILMSILLIAVNYWISKMAWIPFYSTLKKIKEYNINETLELNLSPTSIREFNQLNRVLNTMSKKIRADFLNLKEFTEDASHEIQTPLSIIKSKLELLFQADNLSTEQAQNISVIYEATTRLSRLNNSLLLLSKIQNKQYSHTEYVNLSIIIEKFLMQFKEIIQQKNITITKNYFAQTALDINPDLNEILISNLLGNAVKHNVNNGFITIELTGRELTITNTGQPLQLNANDLFKRFRKANISSDSSGLGLSIVKKIVSLFNMHIEYTTNGNIHSLKLTF